MTSSVTLVTLYITIVSQLHEDQRTVGMNTKQSFIATTGLKLVKDVGLFNMITKPTLYSIHKFDYQWLNTQSTTSFSLQIISSSSVARLASPKKPSS